MVYTKLYFGSMINEHWNLLEIIDQNKNPTEYIAVRGEFWDKKSEVDFNKLILTKKVIGLSSYQCFPKFITNPHENRGPENEDDSFIKKYGHLVIFWCHCFRDPINYIPQSIPSILYSETDQYPNVPWLKTIANTVEKKYDFFASIQEGDWNSWIRGINVAKVWLNYMAEKMGLKILVCGSGRRSDFHPNIKCIDFLPWQEFIETMNTAKYLFCGSRYDASPRILMEALGLNIPILVNEHLIGGWKYVNERTGSFFFPDENVEQRVNKFIEKCNNKIIDPYKWIDINFDSEKNCEILAKKINNLYLLKMNDIVDGVICVELYDNPDFYNNLKKFGISGSILYKIEKTVNKSFELNRTLSHIKALTLAKKNKFKKILILENNFNFNILLEKMLFMINNFYINFNKWDVLLLGCNNSCGYDDTYIDYIKRAKYSNYISGYITNDQYIDTLNDNYFEGMTKLKNELEALENKPKFFSQAYTGKKTIDESYKPINVINSYWNTLQKKNKFYVTNPNIGL